MQTYHPCYLPLGIAQAPYHNKFIGLGWRFALGMVNKLVQPYLYRAKACNRVNFYTALYQHTRYLAANVIFERIQQGLFRGHEAALIMVKFNTICIYRRLGCHIAGVISCKINAIHMQDGVVQLLIAYLIGIRVLTLCRNPPRKEDDGD